MLAEMGILIPGLRVILTGLMMKINVKLKMMKIMKKYYILLSAALVSLALASCQKEKEEITYGSVVEPKVEAGVIPFDLNAHIAETKTTLNTSTYAVTWQGTDVLYAVTTDEEWGAGTSSSDASGDNIATFTYDGDKFSTDKVISEGSHTFNFIYEGSGQKKYHRSAGTKHQLYATQSVDAENPAQNLKSNDALVGQITKTIPATLADITLSHIYTLMKVTIKNKLGADVTASKFEIEIEDEDIAGVFDVAFDTPGVSLNSSGTDKITVNITNGSIANNGSIDIYFVMAPVTDFTGDVTFTVTDSESKTYTKTNSVADLTFAAGTYNTANFTLKPAPMKTYERITDMSELETGEYVILGSRSASSFGLLTYGSLSSNRLAYTKSYSSLPSSIESNDANSIWTLTVAGTETITAKIYNSGQDKYLRANSALSFVAAATATSFTVTEESDMFRFAASASSFLGVNSSSDWWRDYASGTLYASYGIALYKYEEPANLVSIAIDGSSTHSTEFYQGDSFSYDGLVVKATYDNSKVKTVTPTSVSTPDMSVIADDVTVTVTYTEGGITKTTTYTIDIVARPVFSVTLGDDSTILTEASAGAGVVLPSRTPPSGYVFEGWSLTNVSSETATAPTIIPSGSYSPTANVTVYPVYSREVSETRWNKITDLSTVTAGVYALIDSDGRAFNGTMSSGHGQSTATAFTFVDGVASSAPSGTCELTLTASSTGFTMYNATYKYLYASAASSGSLDWHDSESSFWKFASSNWIYNSNSAYLRTYNHSFRTYSKASNSALLMAKKVTTDVTYYISDPS